MNDHVSTEDGVVYRSSSTLGDDSLEITPVHPQHRQHRQALLQNLNKRSSIQLNGNLEVLSEEGTSKDKGGVDGLPLIHSPSEKRYKLQHSLDANQ